ncbi:hypothetical protein D3C76_1358700 [compost metagenome]
MPLARPLWRVLSRMSRSPLSTTQAASAKAVRVGQSKSSTMKPASGANTALPIRTGVIMLASHLPGVSFQRTTTPMPSTTISSAISGRNRASK